MATTFNLTRNEIITRSFNIINAFESNETPSAADFSLASDLLNMMVLHWSAHGIHLFQRRIAYLFPQYNQSKYTIDSNSSDHITDTYYQTTLSADEALGQTVLSVTSTANITVDDHIGIILDDGTIQWSTVASKTSTTVTIDDALTGATAADSIVYNYTTKLDKPLNIHYAFRRDTVDNSDIPMIGLSHSDYWKIPVKEDLGTPIDWYYDVQINDGDFYLWPAPSDVTTIVGFSSDRRCNDFVNATDYPDFPREWLMAIIHNLAVYLSGPYGKFDEVKFWLEPLASKLLSDVTHFDQEEIDLVLSLKPDRRI